jgi:hypothetical protein
LPNLMKQPVTQSPPGFSRRAGELRSELLSIPPGLLSTRTGSNYFARDTQSGEFHFQMYDKEVVGKYPDFIFFSKTGVELPEFQQLLLLYYFATADGTIQTGKFVSFADLPGGRMYAQAFQSYSGHEVEKVFVENLAAFKTACERENGQQVEIADAAYIFYVFPKVSAQIVYWLGDEDFPSTCNILFDSAATHFLPIDACAIVGSHLAQRVIKNHLKTVANK